MEYHTFTDKLENENRRDRAIIYALIGLLGVLLVFIPQSLKNSNPVLVQTEKGFVLSELEPWKLSTARIESFTKAYGQDPGNLLIYTHGSRYVVLFQMGPASNYDDVVRLSQPLAIR